MVKLNKIYTKTGDDGTTGLIGGARRKKFDLRIEAYGVVDEANSQIGKARALAGHSLKIDNALLHVQNDLFDLGSDLANPPSKPISLDNPSTKNELRINKEQIIWLEKQIDYYNENLEPLNSFVLPGGSLLACEFHLARTFVRRAERVVAKLIEEEPFTNPFNLHYLNRLSDLLFVLARVANENGEKDILWQPGRFQTKNS